MYTDLASLIPSAPIYPHDVVCQEILSCKEKNIRDEINLRRFLTSEQWPIPLQDFFINSENDIYSRYFIYDDSGSMALQDGNILVGTNIVRCSRWQELHQTIDFQMRLCKAGLINAKFIFLNLGTFSLGCDFNYIDNFIAQFKKLYGGGTPLCSVINQIIQEMQKISIPPNKKIEIVICTDGLASDGDVGQLIFHLVKSYPVKVVIRLCTDEDRVVNYWNRLDSDLELGLDIIDDFMSEAKEVYKVNSKICYPKCLHQMREFGVTDMLLDLIDEQEYNEFELETYSSLFNSNPKRKFYCTVEKRQRNIVKRQSTCTVS